jgi:hypothetical protein
MIRAACLLVWIGMLSAAFAQQPTASANGNARGQAEAPSQAAQKLYRVTAQITNDPSSGYQTPQGDQSDWPAVTEAQRQWYATPLDGLSRQDRARLIPCAAHLNTAIDAMERGYRIEISQKDNSAAQKSVQTLYARGRKEFGLCSPADLLLTSTSATVEPPEPQRHLRACCRSRLKWLSCSGNTTCYGQPKTCSRHVWKPRALPPPRGPSYPRTVVISQRSPPRPIRRQHRLPGRSSLAQNRNSAAGGNRRWIPCGVRQTAWWPKPRPIPD